MSFPPASTTTMLSTLPVHLYQEFQDDDDLQAFVTSTNQIIQEYVSWFNGIGLPIYTSSQIVGALLDWVGRGIYFYPRPSFATPPVAVGELGQIELAQVEMAGDMIVAPGVTFTASDDEYKRCLTWHLYKGDGWNFSIPWLKRRLHRFLNGPNGTTSTNDNTYDVSVKANGRSFVITFETGGNTEVPFLAAAINAGGVLALPFQYLFSAAGS